ncbi:hypothetical protein AB833_24715 [Chromatiales bacterium (ex Bugula neritina AB1)]|nr:hypothetical protein AB833_24715 [Chromatiales bacterium (ex Bugula neritina AB1)]
MIFSNIQSLTIGKQITQPTTMNINTLCTGKVGSLVQIALALAISSCSGGSSVQPQSGSETSTADLNVTSNTIDPFNPEPASPPANYCDRFTGQAQTYFCEDFTNTSPDSLMGSIPPMSFRDQTFREYTKGEVFALPDPEVATLSNNVIDLHTDTVDGLDYSHYARNTQAVARHWDITAHSRDGYVSPGSGSGFNDPFWWNENAFMGEHGNRCGKPPIVTTDQNPDRSYTFMVKFFNIPADYNGDEYILAAFWKPDNEITLLDSAGVHPIVRYEDMIYLCADHLMTAAYAAGASKLTLTPDHLLDTSDGSAIVEFSVSTYRTTGRDYWQLDLTPLETHLQLPEGDVVADANGKAVNGFNINTALDEGRNSPQEILGNINVFRTLVMKGTSFLENGEYISPKDPQAVYKRAQIANPGNPERLDLYAEAPQGESWVITHSNYNQVMYDHLNGDNNPDITLYNVTDNRKRARFRLTILKTPTRTAWANEAEKWDQVSLCMPEYGNGCIGEYIVPELHNELVVQFTHYAYNTTKSCDGRQPHNTSKSETIYQTSCHPNTYHWDDFYLSPGIPFTIIKATERTQRADSNAGETITLYFDEPAPPNSVLRFNALTGGSSNDATGATSLQMSFDAGASWHTPQRQYEPENNFDKFRSYYTGISGGSYIPEGTTQVIFRAENASYRDAFWIRDASIWSVNR